MSKALEFASIVARFNPQSAEIQAKVIPYLLQKSKKLSRKSISFLDKLALALKSLICLHERHPESPKLLSAKVRFFKHWLSLTEEQRTKDFGDEKLYQVSLQELKSIGIPDKVEDLEKLVSEALPQAKTTIENANEYIKLRMKVVSNAAENGSKFQEIALAALENDANKGEKVKKAENLLRRIVKSGSDGESFKAKAKAEYKYATAFA